MRALPVVLALPLVAGWSVETPRHSAVLRDPTEPALSTDRRRAHTPIEDASLTAAQIERYGSAYQPGVRACYLQHALGVRTAAGTLSLAIRILPGGDVAEVSVRAPGITGNRLRALSACVREEVSTWHFPVARQETVAELPYEFHRYDLMHGRAVAGTDST
jgi:hypothetical protein